MKADLSAFRKQMRDTLAVTKKEEADFLNKRSIQVLIGSKGYPGAVALTYKSEKSKIRRELGRKYHVSGTRGKKSGGDAKLLFIKASKMISKMGTGKGLNFAQYRDKVAEVALRIFSARAGSRAYLAAGWLAAVADLGFGLRRSSGVALRSASRAIGSGEKATTQRLTFQAVNKAESRGPKNRPQKVGAILEYALQRAMRGQIKDMQDYLRKKVEKAMKRNSDSK